MNWQHIIESMSAGVIVLDAQDCVVDLNLAAQRIIGRPVTEVIGKPADQVLSNWPDLVKQYRHVAKAQAEIAVGEDRAQRSFDLRTSPLHDQRGRLIGRLAVVHAITERQQAEEEIRQRNRELTALNTIAAVVSQSLDLHEILKAALDQVLEIMHLDVGGIYLADPERRALHLVVHRGISEEFAHEVESVSVDEKTLAAVTTEGRLSRFILSVRAITKDRAVLRKIMSAMKKEGLSLTSSVPVLLQAKGEILGLMVGASRAPRQFSQAELPLLTSIGQQIAVAIQNARLYQEVQRELAERKRAEDAARSLAKFPDENPNPIVRIGGDGNVLYANKAADLLLPSFAGAVGSPAPALWRDWVTQALVSQADQAIDVEHEGRVYAFDVIPITEGGYVNVYARDITARKRAAEQYRIIVRTALDGFWIADMQGRFLDVNDAYCNLIGYSREELLTMSIPDVEAVEKPEETAARIRKIMEVGGDRFETRHRCKDGRIVDLEVGVNSMRAEERMFVFLRDITGRKRAEEALRESEEKLKEAQALGRIGNWEFDLANQSIKWSDEAYRLYERDPAMGPPSAEEEAAYYSPEQAKRLHEYARCAIEQGQTFEYDLEARLPSGRIAHFTAKMRPVQDETGRVVRLFGTVQDITERKRAEGQIRRRNEELAALNRIGQAFSRLAPPSEIVELLYTNIGQVLDNRNLYIALYDEASQSISFPVYTINGERRTPASRPFGNGLTEYVIRTKAPLLIPRNQPAFLTEHGVDFLGTPSKCFLAVPMRVGERVTGVIAIQNYERENVYDASHMELLDTLASQATIALENARLYSAVQQELDVRKQAEEALAQERNLLRTLIDNLPDRIYAKDTEARFVLNNIAHLRALGAQTQEEVVGKTDSDFRPRDLAAQYFAGDRAVIQSGEPLLNREEPAVFPTGEPGWLLTTKVPLRDPQGKVIGLVGISRDITARKQAEEEIKQRAAQLEALRQVGLEITAELDLDALLRSIVSLAIELLGGTSGGLYLYRPDQDVLEWAVSVGSNLAPIGTTLRRGEGLSGKVWEAGAPLIVNDYQQWERRAVIYKDYPWMAVLGTPVRWGKEFLGVINVLAETPGAFSPADAELLSLFASQAAIAIKNARLYDAAQRELAERKQAEEALRRRAEELAALQATVLDIISPHSLPELLRLIVERAAHLLHASSGGLYLTDPEHRQVRCVVSYNTRDDFTGTLLGYGVGAAGHVAQTGQPLIIDDYRHWPGRADVFEEEQPFQAVISAPLLWQGNVTGVVHVLREDVSERFTPEDLGLLVQFANHAAVAVENARLRGALEQELTEHKQAEEALRESEGRFRLLYEKAPLGYQALDAAGCFIDVNQAWLDTLGYSRAEVIGRWFGDFLAPHEVEPFKQRFPKFKATGEIQVEVEMVRKDGAHAIIAIVGRIGYDEHGGFKQTHCILTDITARKRAEEQLRASLREKEVLLQEIHHRVKNNLQVVSSLLSLQAEQTKDRQTFEAFRESQNRIRSMALIHEKLYQSPDLARIDFAEYLQSLATALCRSYGADVRGISLSIQTDEVFLGIDRAAPCGLLLNELISNALKHAFPAGRAGEIRIALRPAGEDLLTLVVGDNGVGLPQDLDLRHAGSLGLQLVNTLVSQLGGTITLHRHGGTEFEITLAAPGSTSSRLVEENG